MAFQQGLSGLNAASKSIDVISNNIGNAGTAGFKSSQAHFADVFAASLQGGSASQVGIGVSMTSVFQQFTQGNITATNNPLDVSINGSGLFRMSSQGVIGYTRSGQFHVDKTGFIVNDQELRLTGFPVDAAGVIVPSSPVELQISAAQIPPRATSDPVSGDIQAVLNLDSRSTNPAVAPFSFSNPQTYNFSTGLSVYDTLGVAHTLSTYYVRAGAGAWDVHVTLDNANPQSLGRLTFDTNGALNGIALPVVPPAVPVPVAVPPATPRLASPTFPLTTGAVTPWSPGNILFTGSTQFGSESSVDRLAQGGYASGSLAGIAVADDGVIQGRYSNGQTRNLGQVVLADFTNLNGLQPMGDNLWIETAESGPALIGAPNTGGLGLVNASSIEESNVDLTNELVAMITQQRNYQANAQSIKTQDQIMNTLVNLR